MEDYVLSSMLAILTFLTVATATAFSLRKSKIPYAVSLLIIGIFLAFISDHLTHLNFLNSLHLSPELIFYVFLPTLIFESAFHINLKQFTQNIPIISTLSIVGMLMSSALIGGLTHYFLDLPWLFALLFGTIVSATDPISILSLFKQIGAPKRLSIIIEGESLFNDGTALVMFGILLEFILNKTAHFGGSTVFYTLQDFLIVIVGGLAVGLSLGLLFTKALDYVKNSKEIEITITLLLAHFTFIVAESLFGVSGIIATVAAGLVIGNYGAYKISPSIKEIVTHFWDYSAFLVNSLIFLMVGFIVYSTKDSVINLLPSIGIIILIAIVSRMIMIYTLTPLVNLIHPKNRISRKWMHIIQWSGIRGALAIALVLTLPKDIPFYEEILIFTVSIVLFTNIFNGLTISPLIKKLGLRSFSILEKFQYNESRMLINQRVEQKLLEMRDKKFVSQDAFQKVMNYYKSSDNLYKKHIKQLFKKHQKDLCSDNISRILKHHLLCIEKQTFVKLYSQEEITQDLLNILLNNISLQLEQNNPNKKVELGRIMFFEPTDRIIQKLKALGFKKFHKKIKKRYIMLRYQMFRARIIAIDNVLETLTEIKNCNLFFDQTVLQFFEKKYRTWRQKAKKKLKELEKSDPKACLKIQIYLAQKAALHVESKNLKTFLKTEIANSKVYNRLKSDLANRAHQITEI